MTGLFVIILLFGLLYFVMIRPQQAKQRQQQRMLSDVDAGDEILTVGGIYGIVQEVEPDEDGGDLVVEIAEGIHVRIARKAVATVVKPDDDEDEDEDEADDEDAESGAADEREPADAGQEDAGQEEDGVEEVNGAQETVNPDGAGAPAPPDRS